MQEHDAMTLNINARIQMSEEAGLWYGKGLVYIPKSLCLPVVLQLGISFQL